MQPVPRLVPLGLVIAFVIALCGAAGAGRLAAAAAGETLVYKKAGDAELKLFVEKPPGWKPGDRRPAIVFFFGGGWTGGCQVTTLEPQDLLQHVRPSELGAVAHLPLFAQAL